MVCWCPSVAGRPVDCLHDPGYNGHESFRHPRADDGLSWTRGVAFPEWSHDGRFIYYVKWTDDPAVIRIRAADGKRETVADLKGRGTQVSIRYGWGSTQPTLP